MFGLTFGPLAVHHKLEEKGKVDDRVFCTPFVMKVDEKSGRMGNHTEGASKTVFVLICRRFNWRSSQMGFSRGGPRLLFVPEFSAVAEIVWVRGLDCLPVRYGRIEHK